MGVERPQNHLAILLGALRQDRESGELVLDQSDGQRRLFLHEGQLVHLRSSVAGEQFGSYLLRQGLLDTESLNQLLADPDRHRLGVKAVLVGLLSVEERDDMLQGMQEQIMVHALEHRILRWTWTPGAMEDLLSHDLHFYLQHRRFVWRTFHESNDLSGLVEILEAEPGWQWEGQGDLLALLGDLPLTPAIAYALSFLTAGPVSFETFHCLSALEREEAARLLATLWALGALDLAGSTRPGVTPRALPQPPAPTAAPWPAAQEAPGQPAAQEASGQPGSWPVDLPPCGPRAASPAAPEPPAIQLDPAPVASYRFPPAPGPLLPPPPATSPQDLLPGPDRVPKLKALARRLASQGMTVEAIRTLEQVVRFQPAGDSAFEAWLMLGKLRMVNPAWSTRAIDALLNAARIRPRATEPWTTMGEIYQRKGFAGEAAACYRKARTLDSTVIVPPDVDLDAALTQARAAGAVPRGILEAFRSLLPGTRKN